MSNTADWFEARMHEAFEDGETFMVLSPEDAQRILQALAATPAPAAQKEYHKVAQRLYALLDDIDTAGDIAKGDDKLYREIVERTQAKKCDLVVSCDGHTVVLVDDAMLAAAQAQEGPK